MASEGSCCWATLRLSTPCRFIERLSRRWPESNNETCRKVRANLYNFTAFIYIYTNILLYYIYISYKYDSKSFTPQKRLGIILDITNILLFKPFKIDNLYPWVTTPFLSSFGFKLFGSKMHKSCSDVATSTRDSEMLNVSNQKIVGKKSMGHKKTFQKLRTWMRFEQSVFLRDIMLISLLVCVENPFRKWITFKFG